MNANESNLDHALNGYLRAQEVPLRRYLRYLGASPELTAEIAQDSLLLATREFRNRRQAPPHNWLRGVARNLFFKSQERGAFNRFHTSIDEAEAAWQVFSADDNGEAYLDALRLCLERLKPRSRRVLELRYAEQENGNAIAREMKIGKEGVRTILRRAKAALSQCIKARVEA